MKPRVRRRWLQGLAIAAGLALGAIGLRFGLVPRSAARFFGLDTPAAPAHLHYVVAVRDLWLALLVLALAALREWRALALWLGLAALACLADAAIVVAATGWIRAILFHVVSGLICLVLAIACWREAAQEENGARSDRGKVV
jgi:hypothetical protein